MSMRERTVHEDAQDKSGQSGIQFKYRTLQRENALLAVEAFSRFAASSYGRMDKGRLWNTDNCLYFLVLFLCLDGKEAAAGGGIF